MLLFSSLALSSGAFLGWGLGANDAANVFGTAVGTNVIKNKTAVILTSVFLVIGAVVTGRNGVDKLGAFAASNGVIDPLAAFFAMLAAGLAVLLMTYLKIPVSASQCVIGGIVGWGVAEGTPDFSELSDFASAWIVTPVGSLIVCFILCRFLTRFIEKHVKNLGAFDTVIKLGYLISGIFGAFSLGANNVANVTGIYCHIFDWMTPLVAVIIGGACISVGVLTYSKNVMSTVGGGITSLSPISGFMVVLSCSIVVFIYAIIGIPVSTSQAVVGAVIGAGLVNGVGAVNFRVLRNIFIAWVASPASAGILGAAFGLAVKLVS